MPAARRPRVTRAVAAFDPIPSRHPSMDVAVHVASSVPEGATALGVRRSVGANAFGTRLLADFALNFRRPAA